MSGHPLLAKLDITVEERDFRGDLTIICGLDESVDLNKLLPRITNGLKCRGKIVETERGPGIRLVGNYGCRVTKLLATMGIGDDIVEPSIIF